MEQCPLSGCQRGPDLTPALSPVRTRTHGPASGLKGPLVSYRLPGAPSSGPTAGAMSVCGGWERWPAAALTPA